jgi:F5/8 type C domain
MRRLMLSLTVAFVFSVARVCLADPTPIPTASVSPQPVIVDVDTTKPIQIINPLLALGSTVDKEPAGTLASLYSKHNITLMLQSGLGWLSYRLFTELSVQDWHWNPRGTFSEGYQGYWTSSASTAQPVITDSYGYRLPHRGFTTDQGNNEDYSRLDDGNRDTYWKSNPYLTSSYTGDPDQQHPQWVVVDLGAFHRINEVRIDWANPYAIVYRIEYWTGDDAIKDPGVGEWLAFPEGQVSKGEGGVATIGVAPSPMTARFVRVLMLRSSNTCDSHGPSDRRNCVGYAVNEIFVGAVNRARHFVDYVRHAPCGGENPQRYACGWRQTATFVSSVDPWHTSANRVRNQEQPGLDLIARSGLTRGLGAMYPVPMLYSTPQNAVNEIGYLITRHYPIEFVELGEEPDGQYTEPEDDAALFLQWAKAIHALYPRLKLGGPVFSGVNTELQTWPDAQGNISWLNRFLNYLRAHGQLHQLAFMSFEHYPFGGCDRGDLLRLDLLQEPSIMKGIVNQWRSDGLPDSVPMYISEANFSAVNFTQVPMQIEGALWQADYMASALANGVKGVVYYQYEPVPLSQNQDCPSDWGNLTMFVADHHANVRAYGAQFFAAQMLTKYWLSPSRSTFTLYSATTDVLRQGLPPITAYAAKREDNVWSVLLINKDSAPHTVFVRFPWPEDNERPAWRSFGARVDETVFGAQQYQWQSRGSNSAPDPDAGPQTTSFPAQCIPGCCAASRLDFVLPPQAIVVLQGSLSQPVTECG